MPTIIAVKTIQLLSSFFFWSGNIDEVDATSTLFGSLEGALVGFLDSVVGAFEGAELGPAVGAFVGAAVS